MLHQLARLVCVMTMCGVVAGQYISSATYTRYEGFQFM